MNLNLRAFLFKISVIRVLLFILIMLSVLAVLEPFSERRERLKQLEQDVQQEALTTTVLLQSVIETDVLARDWETTQSRLRMAGAVDSKYHFQLMSASGTVLGGSQEAETTPLITIDNLRLVLDSDEPLIIQGSDSHIFCIGTTFLDSRQKVAVLVTKVDWSAQYNETQDEMIHEAVLHLAIAVLVVGAIFLMIWGLVALPLRKLGDLATQAVHDEVPIQLPKFSMIELQQVGEALNSLLEHLNQQHAALKAEFAKREQAQGTLEKTQEHLEELVKRRTSELEKVNSQLWDSEKQYRLLISTMAEGVVMRDADYRVLTYNERAKEILGLTLEEMEDALAPRNWRVIYEEGSIYTATHSPTRVTLETGRPQRDVVMGVEKQDGSVVWINLNTQPLFRDGNAKPYAVVTSYSDITHRKTAEKQLADMVLEKQRSQILAKFVRNIAHEFRTPLTAMQTALYLFERTDDDEKRAKQIEKIQRYIDQIVRLTDSMTMLVKLDNISDLSLRTVFVNDLLKDVVERLAPLASAKGNELVLEATNDSPMVAGSPSELAAALVHLIENAIRYTESAGQITVSAKSQTSTVVISITDTGIGMSQEQVSHIFERFFRADDAHSTRGFGLGLPIAQKVIDMHGGTIDVVSQLGKGTTFRVILPLAPKP